jgi:hypothetical protein
VTNRANVRVRLSPLKLFLGHFSAPSPDLIPNEDRARQSSQ